MLFEHAVAGIAHVDTCIISFEIQPDSTALTWTLFCHLLRLTNKDDKLVDTNDTSTGQRLHAITASAGVVQGDSNRSAVIKSNEESLLLVDISTFSFRFSTLCPISEVDHAAGR